jgi:hypothetical protein
MDDGTEPVRKRHKNRPDTTAASLENGHQPHHHFAVLFLDADHRRNVVELGLIPMELLGPGDPE